MSCDVTEAVPPDSDEELDPRVQVELEKLNTCTDNINHLEKQFDDANNLFRSLMSDSTHQLKALNQKLGNCIEKARPYYEALERANKAQQECQKAATNFQRANGIHAAAKETITLAEERFLSNSSDWEFDNAWQEMLNHATMKVMEAEKLKTESEAEHLKRAAYFTQAEQEVQALEKKLKKHIQKSQPYFEQKDLFKKALESQKKRIQELQEKVTSSKRSYAQSLRNLEEISNSIHAQRKLKLPREPGVGAELDSLPTYDLDQFDHHSISIQSETTSGAASELFGLDDTLSLDDAGAKFSPDSGIITTLPLSTVGADSASSRGSSNAALPAAPAVVIPPSDKQPQQRKKSTRTFSCPEKFLNELKVTSIDCDDDEEEDDENDTVKYTLYKNTSIEENEAQEASETQTASEAAAVTEENGEANKNTSNPNASDDLTVDSLVTGAQKIQL